MKTISRRLLITVLSLFALACAIRAPLSLITPLLPKHIQMKNVEGSLWSGRASAIGVGGVIIQQGVRWDFQPRALLSAGLAWRISGRYADKASQLTIDLRFSGPGISGVSVFFPLEPLAALHPKLKGAQVGALLHLTTSRLAPHTPAKITLDVDQLFSALAPQAGQLGRYQLDFDLAADGKGRWMLASQAGLIAAVGDGQIDVYRDYLGGRLVVTPSTAIPGLSPVLSQLPRAGEGYVIVL